MDDILKKSSFQQSVDYEFYTKATLPSVEDQFDKQKKIKKLNETREYAVAIEKIFNNVMVEEPVKLKLQRVSEHIELLKQYINEVKNISKTRLSNELKVKCNLLISASYDSLHELAMVGYNFSFIIDDFNNDRFVNLQKSIDGSVIGEKLKNQLRDKIEPIIMIKQLIVELKDATKRGLFDISSYRSLHEIFTDALKANTNLIEYTELNLVELENEEIKEKRRQKTKKLNEKRKEYLKRNPHAKKKKKVKKSSQSPIDDSVQTGQAPNDSLSQDQPPELLIDDIDPIVEIQYTDMNELD